MDVRQLPEPGRHVLGWMLLGLGGTILLFATRFGGGPEERSGTPTALRVAAVLFGTTLLAYFALPSSVGGFAAALDVRMAVFVGVFFPLLLHPRSGPRGTIPLAGAALVAVAIGLHAGYQVHAFEEEEVGNFDDLLRRMPRGARLLTLNFDPISKRMPFGPFAFFGSYYRARYGGIASFSFSELHHWPVRYRREWAPPQAMTWGNPCLFRNARDGRFFDFVLTHGDVDPFSAEPPGPKWEVVGASRAWRLYARAPGGESSQPTDAADARADTGPCAVPPRVAIR